MDEYDWQKELTRVNDPDVCLSPQEEQEICSAAIRWALKAQKESQGLKERVKELEKEVIRLTVEQDLRGQGLPVKVIEVADEAQRIRELEDKNAELKNKNRELEEERCRLREVVEAIRELERVKTEALMCNQCIVGEIRGRGRCPSCGKRIHKAEVRLNQSLATLDGKEKARVKGG